MAWSQLMTKQSAKTVGAGSDSLQQLTNCCSTKEEDEVKNKI